MTHSMTNIISDERERTGTVRHAFYTFKHAFQTKAEVLPPRIGSDEDGEDLSLEHPLELGDLPIFTTFPGLFTNRIDKTVVSPLYVNLVNLKYCKMS